MAALADQVRDTLEDEIEGIQVEPMLVINPSCSPVAVDVYPADPFQTGIAFGLANNEMMLLIRARVNTPDTDGAQDVLLSLMDPFADTSLAQAVLADRTLSGTVEDAVVSEGPSNYGIFADAGGQGNYLGCTWTVKVTP